MQARAGNAVPDTRSGELPDKRRPVTVISMRFPSDVIDDLKRVAPL